MKFAFHKDFYLILLAHFLAISGLWFGIFANLQFLAQMVPSDFLMSVILTIGPVSLIIASPFAGTIIDQSSTRKIISISGWIQLLGALLQLAAFYTGSLLLLVLALICLHLANAFYTPALRSVIPEIVPQQQLLRANSAYMNITTIARIIITAISGLALSFLPLSVMYAIVVCCYLIMNAVRYMIPLQENIAKNKSQERMPFREVFPLLRREPVLLVLMINIALIYWFLGGSNLVILKFSQHHADHSVQGFLYGVEGIFVLLGGIAAKKLYQNANLLFQNSLLVLGVGCSLLFMAFGTNWVWAAFAGYGLYGFLVGCWSPSYSTIGQITVPEEIRGRFFAFQEMWNRIMQQFSLLYTGFMFDLIGLSNHLLIVSLFILFGAIAVLLFIHKRALQVALPQK